MFRKNWYLYRILCAFSAVAGVFASPLVAQDEAVADALARLMAVEDRREYESEVLGISSRYPDPIVRRHAALSMGRLGDPAAIPLLFEMLLDSDSTVRRNAAFALGLIGDLSGFDRLREFVLDTPGEEHYEAHAEAVTAISRIGGSEAAEFFREFLGRFQNVGEDGPPPSIVRALVDSWRLRESAPVDLLVRFAESENYQTRWGAIYSLARLRDSRGATTLLAATGDEDAGIRSLAVRALGATFADSSGLDRAALAGRVRRLVNDDHEHVRINALRALATFADSGLAPVAIDRMSDQKANVRVQALVTLGRLGGSESVEALRESLDDRTFAIRRQALMSLSSIPGSGALEFLGDWFASGDWRDRIVAAQGLAAVAGDTALAWLEHLSGEEDPRVAAAALSGAARVDSTYARFIARELIGHADAVVRAVAAAQIAVEPDVADIQPLADAFRLSQSDSISDARIAIVRALGAVSQLGPGAAMAVESGFLDLFGEPDDYLVRRAAEQSFPAAAARWRPAIPLMTRREMGDYREIARNLILPAARSGVVPRVTIETDRGRIELLLLPIEAPLTVQNFLELIDRRFFDGGVWHRVVPNFVIQDGDPRGDGQGGPDYAIRDEINVERYERGTLGMALSGPDTGGSQFFITHSAQPHLDGTYTVFGRVVSGYNVLDDITQGVTIRRIRKS